MPLYLCRWRNGDFSVVLAANKADAVDALDEMDNAEGLPITRLSQFMTHFRLSNVGELVFESFGERTLDVILNKGYPILEQVYFATGETSVKKKAIRAAVAEERRRIRPRKVPEPKTELGKEIKRKTGFPTVVTERMVGDLTSKALERFHPRGKPN